MLFKFNICFLYPRSNWFIALKFWLWTYQLCAALAGAKSCNEELNHQDRFSIKAELLVKSRLQSVFLFTMHLHPEVDNFDLNFEVQLPTTQTYTLIPSSLHTNCLFPWCISQGIQQGGTLWPCIKHGLQSILIVFTVSFETVKTINTDCKPCLLIDISITNCLSLNLKRNIMGFNQGFFMGFFFCNFRNILCVYVCC